MTKKKKGGCLKLIVILLCIILAMTIVAVAPGSDVTPAQEAAEQRHNGAAEIKSTKTDSEVAGEWLDLQFSAWDGSNTAIVKLVKQAMNDPKSFEHVETSYVHLKTDKITRDMDEELGGMLTYPVKKYDLFVEMTFRCKNAYGGVVKQKVYGFVHYGNNSGNPVCELLTIE